MKTLKFLLFVVIALATSCKTQKIAPKPEPVAQQQVQETKQSSNPTTNSTSATRATNVSAREEKVSAAQGEASDFGAKRYYIILGSFGIYENAQKFKKQLIDENFKPGILVNESGLYRVSVNSFDDESAARSRVAEIKQNYTKYSDLWLLIKK